jgi:hypothetical protein
MLNGLPVMVAAGSTSLRATIGSPSDRQLTDLFVFNCTSGTCVFAGQARQRLKVRHHQQSGGGRLGEAGRRFSLRATTFNYVDVLQSRVRLRRDRRQCIVIAGPGRCPARCG